MKKKSRRLIGGVGLVLLMALGIGCSPTLKALTINQFVGFAAQLTSAVITGSIQPDNTTTDNTTAL